VVAALIEFMDYTLAKKLKDAGFEQGSNDPLSSNHRWFDEEGGIGFIQHVYIPTLSELIDACGERFDALGKCKDDGVSRIVDGWIAVDEDNKRTWGATKETAVANLWLAINK